MGEQSSPGQGIEGNTRTDGGEKEMLDGNCPGAANIWGTPTLKIKKCPVCGGEVEVFSNDVKVNCERCGFTVYNDLQSCIAWCKYAKECVGEELYNQIMTEKEKKEGKVDGESQETDDQDR
jgi:hypothetical protein